MDSVEFEGTSETIHLFESLGTGALAGMLATVCHGVVLMYSITSRSSFDSIPTWKEFFLQKRRCDTFPMILIATSCDTAGEQKRKVSADEGRALADQIGCPFLEVSAKDNIRVDDAMFQLLIEIKKYRELQGLTEISSTRRRCVVS